jgi:hypothetical protein
MSRIDGRFVFQTWKEKAICIALIVAISASILIIRVPLPLIVIAAFGVIELARRYK